MTEDEKRALEEARKSAAASELLTAIPEHQFDHPYYDGAASAALAAKKLSAPKPGFKPRVIPGGGQPLKWGKTLPLMALELLTQFLHEMDPEGRAAMTGGIESTAYIQNLLRQASTEKARDPYYTDDPDDPDKLAPVIPLRPKPPKREEFEPEKERPPITIERPRREKWTPEREPVPPPEVAPPIEYPDWTTPPVVPEPYRWYPAREDPGHERDPDEVDPDKDRPEYLPPGEEPEYEPGGEISPVKIVSPDPLDFSWETPSFVMGPEEHEPPTPAPTAAASPRSNVKNTRKRIKALVDASANAEQELAKQAARAIERGTTLDPDIRRIAVADIDNMRTKALHEFANLYNEVRHWDVAEQEKPSKLLHPTRKTKRTKDKGITRKSAGRDLKRSMMKFITDKDRMESIQDLYQAGVLKHAEGIPYIDIRLTNTLAQKHKWINNVTLRVIINPELVNFSLSAHYIPRDTAKQLIYKRNPETGKVDPHITQSSKGMGSIVVNLKTPPILDVLDAEDYRAIEHNLKRGVLHEVGHGVTARQSSGKFARGKELKQFKDLVFPPNVFSGARAYLMPTELREYIGNFIDQSREAGKVGKRKGTVNSQRARWLRMGGGLPGSIRRHVDSIGRALMDTRDEEGVQINTPALVAKYMNTVERELYFKAIETFPAFRELLTDEDYWSQVPKGMGLHKMGRIIVKHPLMKRQFKDVSEKRAVGISREVPKDPEELEWNPVQDWIDEIEASPEDPELEWKDYLEDKEETVSTGTMTGVPQQYIDRALKDMESMTDEQWDELSIQLDEIRREGEL